MIYRSIILNCLLVVSCTPSLTASDAEASASRPNIVFLFSDDQTAQAIGCSGNPDIITPNLDQLAREGVRFTNHYNTTSICMASRCCVLTGLYEYRHGCNFEHGDLERRFIEQSYPVKLRQAGYYTGFAGKIGFVLQAEEFEALSPLFDDWAGGPGQTDYETAKNTGIAKYADQFPHCSRAYGAWGQDFFKRAKASGQPFCMSTIPRCSIVPLRGIKKPRILSHPSPSQTERVKLTRARKSGRNWPLLADRHHPCDARPANEYNLCQTFVEGVNFL